MLSLNSMFKNDTKQLRFFNALQDGVHETSIPQLFESSKWHCGTQGRTTLICVFPSLNISPRQMTKFRAKTYVQVIY